MTESLAGSSGLPEDDPNAELRPGRPSTTPEEYNRVVFLARTVVGLTVLAALALTVVSLISGKNFAAIAVSVVMVAAAVFYYVWTIRQVKRDLKANPNPETME